MEDIKYTVFVFALDTIGEVWEPIANMKHHRDIEAYPGPIEIERRFKFSSAAEERPPCS